MSNSNDRVHETNSDPCPPIFHHWPISQVGEGSSKILNTSLSPVLCLGLSYREVPHFQVSIERVSIVKTRGI